ncbi:anther-specific proline-rich protein APG-like [Cryptomeria japonica]|uniref:anther-specific proline-rich protein APG-like n=1 Tax=Cryptomeria japonica TaxID=3369 RepID=UPI0027DA070E|nr:anther-specific proline-rich protein APG-like [Cryptomeria japonica]
MALSSLAEFLQVLVVVLSFMALGVLLSLIVLIMKCMQGHRDDGFSQQKTQTSHKTQIKIVESASPSPFHSIAQSPFPSPFPSPSPFRPIAVASSPNSFYSPSPSPSPPPPPPHSHPPPIAVASTSNTLPPPPPITVASTSNS